MTTNINHIIVVEAIMATPKKPVYILCPRCELNYIQKKDKYCDICKAEMKAGSLEEEEVDDMELEICPVCHINYVADGETMCQSCLENRSDDDEDNIDWKDYLDKKDDEEDDDLDIDEEDDDIDEELDSVFS